MPEPAQFVAREKELEKMHQTLHGSTHLTTVVLHGLGGIGKTQLAIAYALRHKDKYTAIFWVNSNDEDSLKLSFLDAAQQIKREHPTSSALTNLDMDRDDKVVDAVKDWLSLMENTKWLLIFDNYDKPRSACTHEKNSVNIHQFLPPCDHGSVIVTTRSSQVSIGEHHKIETLQSTEDGLEILSRTSQRQNTKQGMQI